MVRLLPLQETEGIMSPISPSRVSITAVLLTAIVVASGARLKAAAAILADTDIGPIRAGAERGSVEKEIELGAAYATGHGVALDKQLAAYWYGKAAGAGDPAAENQIGYFYQVGFGVPVDLVRAVHWYQLAAAEGFTGAKVNLGVSYIWGLGVTKNEKMAAQLFREAASKGSGTGACYLGDMYYFGVGVDQDKSAAEHWYLAGRKLHDPRAEFSLGVLYLTNGKDARNLGKAADSFRDSVKAGFVPAMHALGKLLVENPDLSNSPEEGMTLLTNSANAGIWKSSAVLGILARDGKGREVNYEAAYYQFKVAALQGGEVARKLLESDLSVLSAKLGAEKVGPIDLQAESWSRLHHPALEFVTSGVKNEKRLPPFSLAEPEDGSHAGLLIPTRSAGADRTGQNIRIGNLPNSREREDPLAKSLLEE
jgi:uncharacterized protein